MLTIFGWYRQYDTPVWPKKGISPWYQQFLAQHLPPIHKPDVFVTLLAYDPPNTDALIGEVVVEPTSVVYVMFATATIAIEEIQAINGAMLSIKENS